LTANEYFSKSDFDSDGEPKAPKVNMFCKNTKYVAVKESGKLYMEWHLSKRSKSDWDVGWFDQPIDVKFLKNMKANQRVNHFPAMHVLARKNMLGRQLSRMQRVLPDDYDFFPSTYCLPHDYKDFLEEVRGQKNPRTFICKPDDSS